MNLIPIEQPTAVEFDPFAGGELLLTAPVTESQKEIWASVRMGDDANCAYNESQSLRLQGNLNVEALQSALQALVQRHEALRTTFSPDGQNLCISDSLILEIPFIDLSALGEQEKTNRVSELLKQSVSQPFDLENGPLFRTQLVKLASQEHFLLMTVHHIICDGWSWGVMMPDLGNFYSAFCQGNMPQMEPAERFSDYALQQEEEANGEEANGEEAIATIEYWLQQFSGSVPMLDFPVDRTRPALRTFESARLDWTLDAKLVASLKLLGMKSGASFMTTMLAGFEVFLARESGQNDIVVGIPAAGQVTTGFTQLVGHCVNLLPLRTQVKSDRSFSDYLKQRKSTVLNAYDRQQFTFGKLVQKLSLPRDPSRIPLVPIVFNIDRALEADSLPFTGLEAEFITNPRAYENFEIFINGRESQNKVILECQYNTNLFDAETIRRRMAEFETLLSAIVANPERTIATLPLLPETQQQLLTKWNSTQRNYPQDKCIHQLVEEQVALTPDAIAVVFADRQLTYLQLNEAANRLANYLQALGVKPESLVGICVERSLEMVIAILSVLKAGGAYVPIDPVLPRERIAYMMEDAKISILLTQQVLKANLPDTGARMVYLDSDGESIATSSATQAVSGVTSTNLSYIIYTSGSTGKPKGVQIQHQSVVNLLNSVRVEPGLTGQDTLLSVTTFSFDISVSEIFLPLIVGAKLVLVSREVAGDGNKLLGLLKASETTFLQATPATWRMLLTAGWQGNPGLKMVSTGEPLPQELAEQLLPKGAELWNLYGPTETTIWSTAYRVESSDKPIYIGRAIANTKTYILDAHLQPVPVGVPGELYIGGLGLARGYLNRPDLTAEHFIKSPFESGERLYKTGDLTRFLNNGCIECLGRLDYQVKIRGFRIELGEIEAVLSQHPSVRECVVVARKQEGGDERLVAYIIGSRGDSGATISELRSYLKQQLPEYMVPANFMLLDSMPLTPSGKMDRKALPEPDVSRLMAENYVAPRNEVEKQMTKLWAQVLKLDRVGIRDNFFEMGGHSLLAAQLIARIRQVFAVDLPMRTLFEASTTAELVERVETILWAAQAVNTNNDMMEDYEEGEI
ncbi:non-ribosomal peptide synthetase [Brunnivagina elsteri]|uniref:Non-ribosomal peptide synthetase n=1 Tax=Brunnivagina elsteri CCALA 953 TaxID=987040 RepID=A0A2A2TNL3_9CYAN|nr:non-ribosomal peptide synthetase [Calothrix elsteri]PAX59718.1 non-ribosomal peptide synthetase [Calothrix elsteri CCALA 953]